MVFDWVIAGGLLCGALAGAAARFGRLCTMSAVEDALIGRDFRGEKPRRLFSGAYSGAGRETGFDVAPGARRFVMVKSDPASALRHVVVVQNWFKELRARLSAERSKPSALP